MFSLIPSLYAHRGTLPIPATHCLLDDPYFGALTVRRLYIVEAIEWNLNRD